MKKKVLLFSAAGIAAGFVYALESIGANRQQEIANHQATLILPHIGKARQFWS